MAKYTIELRKICDILSREEVESWFKSYKLEDYLLPDQLSLLNSSNIWSKDKLAKKIVNHYFLYEIGVETIEQFKLFTLNTMEEIMEEMLPLIYTTAIEYDPLINVDFTETFNREASGEGENTGVSQSNSNSNSSGISIHSDTPQGNINKENILNGTYASDTSASESNSNINDNTSSTSSGSTKNKESYIKNTKGNSGINATYQKMIEQFRDNVRAYDKEIIDRVSILFMSLY